MHSLNIKIISTNQNGSRSQFHQSYTKDLIHYDIVCIQEIKPMHQHDLESMEILSHNEANTKSFFHCTIPNTPEHISVRGEPSSHTPRGGVGIIIKPSMPGHDSAEKLTSEAFTAPVLNNRYICVKLESDLHTMFIHSIYGPVRHNQRSAEFFESLPPATEFPENSIHIIGGDLNLPLNEQLDITTASHAIHRPTLNAAQRWLADLNVHDIWRTHNPDRVYITARTQRVDYLLISDALENTHHLQPDYIPKWKLTKGDHAAPIITIKDRGPQQGTGFWKCPWHLWESSTIRDHIRDELNKLNQAMTNSTNAAAQWNTFKWKIKRYLQQIQRHEGHDLNISINSAKQKANRTHSILASENSQHNRDEYQLAITNLLQLQTKRDNMLRDKAFKRSIRESEKSSRYFFRKPFRSNKGNISSAIDSQGQEHHNFEKIKQIFIDTWKPIFGGNHPDNFHHTPQAMHSSSILKGAISAKLSESDKSNLHSPLREAEITQAIRTGKKHSCPGLDGLPFEMYQLQPDLFSQVLLKVYNQSLNDGEFSPGQRKSAISLLYKKGNPADPTNYRPIALMQVDIKILDRVLNYRIQALLPTLIHQDQKGFISGRSIQTNLMHLQELQHLATHLHQPWFAQFLDFQKAYDRLDWEYMWTVLSTMNFPDSFIKWIKLTYYNNEYLLQLNGHLVPGVYPKTGIRQGSPLSPALYVLAVEPLLQLIRTKSVEYGIPLSPTHYKCLDAFADDTTLYSNNWENAQTQLQLVTHFEHAANAKLNLQKTKILLLNKTASFPSTTDSRILQRTDSTKYLGITVGQSITQQEQLQPVVDKFLRRMAQWKYRARTLDGRVLVIHTLLLSVLWYASASVPMSEQTTKHILSCTKNFLLTRSPHSSLTSNLTTTAWATTPKKQGGLGLLNIDQFIQRDRLVMIQLLMTTNLHNQDSSWHTWTIIALQNIRNAAAATHIHTHGLDFLHWNLKSPEGRKLNAKLSPWWQHTLLIWNKQHWKPLNFNDPINWKWVLNFPLFNTTKKNWKLLNSISPGQRQTINLLRKHKMLHCLGEWINSYGLISSYFDWNQYILTTLQLQNTSYVPTNRCLRSIYDAGIRLIRQFRGTQTRSCYLHWKLTWQDWTTWPWELEHDITHSRFQNLNKDQIYAAILPKPNTPHPITKFRTNVNFQLPHLRPLFHHWIRPTAYNTLLRIQLRLLPLGFTRIHIPAAPTDCPLCQLNTETYNHLFFTCPHVQNLWQQQLSKWTSFLPEPITWEHMLLSNQIKVNNNWRNYHNAILYLWIVQCACISIAVWELRNSIQFENTSLIPVDDWNKHVNASLNMHIRLVLSSATSPLCNNHILTIAKSWNNSCEQLNGNRPFQENPLP